ncbi:MAG TPA: hypothetical protein VKB75_02190, partial [Jatrophihabitans sp.]|nr:hypothetical protein [Jatrophihabitans sp.]
MPAPRHRRPDASRPRSLRLSGGRHRRIRYALRRAKITTVLAVSALVTMVLVGPTNALAATDASVSITPTTSTVASGTTVTYTMSVSCSLSSGSCTGTTVSFPTTALTGDGTTTDFGSWITNGSCATAGVTLKVTGGTATFTYGNVASGSTSNCTFTVKASNLTTANDAQATITPTIAGSNFTGGAGTPVKLTLTASHNATLGQSTPLAKITSGSTFYYAIGLNCGSGTGDIGQSAITVTEKLPAGFTYTGNTPSGAPGTVTYDAATNTLTYSDPTGRSCGGSLRVTGIAATNGVA